MQENLIDMLPDLDGITVSSIDSPPKLDLCYNGRVTHHDRASENGVEELPTTPHDDPIRFGNVTAGFRQFVKRNTVVNDASALCHDNVEAKVHDNVDSSVPFIYTNEATAELLLAQTGKDTVFGVSTDLVNAKCGTSDTSGTLQSAGSGSISTDTFNLEASVADKEDRKNTFLADEITYYGIRRIIHPAKLPDNRFQVVISNLLGPVILQDVLTHVRGGALVYASVVDTIPITGMKSVVVRFLCARAATAYVEFCRNMAVNFWGHQALVTLTETASFRLSDALDDAIHLYGHTRCLEVRHLPRTITQADVMKDLRFFRGTQHHGMVSMSMDIQDWVLRLDFRAVCFAGDARRMFTSYRCYQGCEVEFVQDPCSLPLDTITLHTVLSKANNPSNISNSSKDDN